MVSADEHHLHMRMERSPFGEMLECRWRTTASGMQKVAKKDDPSWPSSGEQYIKTADSIEGGSMGNGDTGGAKRSGLSEMWVRYEQRPVTLPEDCSLGQQRQCLAHDLDAHVERHGI